MSNDFELMQAEAQEAEALINSTGDEIVNWIFTNKFRADLDSTYEKEVRDILMRKATAIRALVDGIDDVEFEHPVWYLMGEISKRVLAQNGVCTDKEQGAIEYFFATIPEIWDTTDMCILSRTGVLDAIRSGECLQ